MDPADRSFIELEVAAVYCSSIQKLAASSGIMELVAVSWSVKLENVSWSWQLFP
jgi:hypothetical protein